MPPAVATRLAVMNMIRTLPGALLNFDDTQ
jgi:hypothetical protein